MYEQKVCQIYFLGYCLLIRLNVPILEQFMYAYEQIL